MSRNDIKSFGSFVWSIAELLPRDFKQSECSKLVRHSMVGERLHLETHPAKGRPPLHQNISALHGAAPRERAAASSR